MQPNIDPVEPQDPAVMAKPAPTAASIAIVAVAAAVLFGLMYVFMGDQSSTSTVTHAPAVTPPATTGTTGQGGGSRN